MTFEVIQTLNDLQGHLSTASLFKCDFSYSFSAADKISTDKARRAVRVPLRQLSFLSQLVSAGNLHGVGVKTERMCIQRFSISGFSDDCSVAGGPMNPYALTDY